ncbi:MAG: glycosyltransferase family 39 protein [Crocinitomicaceae bacterium]
MDWFTDRRIQAILVLVQLSLCLPFINSFSIDLDEPFSVYWAQLDLKETLAFFAEGNNPPLHNILLHYWEKMFGIGPVSVRSLSLLFSVLTIPVLYALGKKLLNKPYAVIACGLFIFSTFNHYHAIEARMYSLMTLLAVLIFYELYLLIFENTKGFWRLALWNALMLYTHYLGFFIIGCELLVFLLFTKHLDRKKLIYFSVSLLITALLYLPSLITFFKRFSDFASSGTWVAEPHWTELYGNVVRFLNGKEAVIMLIGVAVFFVFLWIFGRRQAIGALLRKKELLFLVSIFAIPYLGMYIFSIVVQPVFLDRYLLYTTPFLYLFIAAIFYLLSTDVANKYFLILIIAPLMVYCQYKPDNNRDADVMANWVNEQLTGNDMVYLAPGYYDLTFVYYFDRELFSDYENRREDTTDNFQWLYHKDALQIDPNIDQVFFVDAHSEDWYPENGIKDSLSLRFNLVDQKEFKGGHIIYRFLND